MTQQVETATVVGTIGAGGAGDATVIVTAARMPNSPKTFSVAVANNDTASQVADKIRTALAFDASVTSTYVVSGATDKVVLTEHLSKANDSTLNISTDNGTCTGLTAAPTSANTIAGVGITDGYCTLADLRSSPALNFESSYTTDDALLADIITSVSRAIDRQCGRYFYKSAAHEVRYFTADNSEYIQPGDIVSVTTLKTDDDGDRVYENTWAITDYDLESYNATAYSEDEPYFQIRVSPQGDYNFPTGRKGVELDAVFGWPAVPAVINQVCLLWSERVYKRLSTPLGIQGTSQIGVSSVNIPAPDGDIRQMLKYYTVQS